MDNIVILGRGQSLERLNEFKEEIDTVILVNCFWDSPQVDNAYYKDPLIHNFIKDKKIIIVCTRCNNFSKINIFIEKYNVIKIYTTNFSRYARISKSDNILKIMPESVLLKYIEFDKLKIKKQGNPIPGSISMGILLATEELKAKNIHIFGQDFYEKDYYLKNNHDYSNEKKPEIIKYEKNVMTLFLRHLSNINFYIYTLSNYKPDEKNIFIQ
tara:strand:- start:1160 stop:1798 length:639 start_codon:yes stop_codon:yes gene_type:complete